MKNAINKRLSFRIFLIICLCSSTAFLLSPVRNLWREITSAQAEKQSLKMPSWAPLVEKAQPAVLVITTEAWVEQPLNEFPGFPFFMPPGAPVEKQQGQGSGFLINEDGYFLTNEHVIRGAQKIKVRVGLNRREYDAKIIGADEALDIALCKIETHEKDPKKKITWPYLPLGDSDKLRIGDPVMAMGSPLGFIQSANYGFVSQKNRGNLKPSGRELYTQVIQFQMPINPGNSGGPVLDDSGRVVAISESLVSAPAGNPIAFGLPINTVKNVLPSLEKGSIEKSFLGIEPTDLTPDLAEKLGLPEEQEGAVIAQIRPHTPAQKAGLEVMDVILEVDGVKISDSFKLRELTAYKGVGHTLVLKVYRQSKGIMEFKVKLERRPDQVAQFSKPQGDGSAPHKIESLGLELGDTPLEVRKELGLSSKNRGAQVLSVVPRSAADAANILPGDIIVKVDKALINSAEQLRNLFDKAKEGSTLLVLLWRGHDFRFVHLKKPSKK